MPKPWTTQDIDWSNDTESTYSEYQKINRKTAQLVRECMNVQMCMQIFLQKMYINNTWNIPHAEVNVTGRLNRNNSMGNRMTEQDDVPDNVSIDTTKTTSSLSAPSQTAAETEEAIVETEEAVINMENSKNERGDKSITMASYTSNEISAGTMASVR